MEDHARAREGQELGWKWTKGAATDPIELGDPRVTAAYELCVYEPGNPAPLLHVRTPAGGTCGTQPCWKASGLGFSYADKRLTPEGARKAKLGPSTIPGKPKMQVKGQVHGSASVTPS